MEKQDIWKTIVLIGVGILVVRFILQATAGE